MPICEDVQTSLPNPTPGPPALPSFVQIKIGIFHHDNFGVDEDGDDIEVDEEERMILAMLMIRMPKLPQPYWYNAINVWCWLSGNDTKPVSNLANQNCSKLKYIWIYPLQKKTTQICTQIKISLGPAQSLKSARVFTN